MITVYTDPIAYRRAPTGQETKSLTGNVLRLSSDIDAGAVSLPVPALTVALAVDAVVTIFDGSNSEEVIVTAPASIGATSISVTATEAAHQAKTIIASDGAQGSLAEMIIEASAWLETITQQPLWSATYSDEKLQAPSMRAAVDRDGALTLRPRRSPVSAVSSVNIRSDTTSQDLDVSAAQLADDGQVVVLPTLNATGIAAFAQRIPLTRTTRAQISLRYTAGYSELPGYIITATNCLVSVLLSDRQNPIGAKEYRLGDKSITMGDTGRSALIDRATMLLRKEIQRSF